MVQFNTRANEILLKLVYYGPGLSGKTTNLQQLHALCADQQRGEMFSVNTQEDRTLFFDLLPINLGYIYGNAIHMQIYTVPGQIQYDASRRVVLGGADGVVFVADSAEAKMQDNVDSLSNLYHNLNANRLNIKQIPLVLQFNKRDLPEALAVGVMNRRLNFRNAPFFEAIASQGIGVVETFRAITRETIDYTFKKFNLDKKVKDLEAMLALIDQNLMDALHEVGTAPAPGLAVSPPASVTLRHSGVSIDTLHPEQHADPAELLEDALKSSMETARLYSDLRGTKESLEKQNQELSQLYAQLEKNNRENQKTRRYIESLLQHLGEAVISFGADGRVLTLNAAAERLFGFSRGEALGQIFPNMLAPTHQAGLPTLLARVGVGDVVRTPLVMQRRGGAPFAAEATFAPIRGAEDRVVAVSALIREPSQAPPKVEDLNLDLDLEEDILIPIPEQGPHKKRILLVEDEPDLLALFAESVEALGHLPFSASHGEEAIQLLSSSTFDFIVSDIRMPGLSGMDLHAWILAHQPEMTTKILFTTGDACDGPTLDFLESHHLPCLPKPFDLRHFQTKLSELMGT